MFAFVFAGVCLRFFWCLPLCVVVGFLSFCWRLPLFLLVFAFVLAERKTEKTHSRKGGGNIERQGAANDCIVSENALPVPVLPGYYY